MARRPAGSITDATIKAILHAYYEAREGATTIAQRHGLNKQTIYNILTKHGKGTRPTSDRTGDTYGVQPSALDAITSTGRPVGRPPKAQS